MREVRALGAKVDAIGEKVSKADERSTYAADIATKAYSAAGDAMRAASENEKSVKDATDAMVRHAATVTASTAKVEATTSALVKSNQEQNPTIDATLAIVTKLQRERPRDPRGDGRGGDGARDLHRRARSRLPHSARTLTGH